MPLIKGNSSYFVIDIETFPDETLDEDKRDKYIDSKLDRRLKDKDKIENKKKQIESSLALNPFTGKILLVGIQYSNNYYGLLNTSLIDDEKKLNDIMNLYPNILLYKDEIELLTEVIHTINEALYNGNIMVSYNGKDFDVPFIMKRALISNIDIGIPYYIKLIKKYPNGTHIDLYEVLQGKLAENIEFILNEKVESVNFEEMINDKNIEKIIDKNINDVKQTYKLYEKMINWITTNIY